jgi:hypothetical protein
MHKPLRKGGVWEKVLAQYAHVHTHSGRNSLCLLQQSWHLQRCRVNTGALEYSLECKDNRHVTARANHEGCKHDLRTHKGTCFAPYSTSC